jgi:3-oxoacyl-[acyl-carrier protein] reductase
MNLQLTDKVALVTAASTGLGLATALELAREGAKVAICARTQVDLDTAVAQIEAEGGTAVAFTTDLLDPDQIIQLVEDVVAHYGRLDILITNAGGPPGGNFDTTDFDAWEYGFNLTLMSAVRLIKAALPHLRQSNAAAILTITSVSVLRPIAGLLLSNVMRPAVAGLTRSLAQELAPDNIRVNAILPGWTATDRVVHIFEDRVERNGTSIEAEQASIVQTIPLRRMAEPAEFGRVATLLVSPAASYVTGVLLPIDGGSTI